MYLFIANLLLYFMMGIFWFGLYNNFTVYYQFYFILRRWPIYPSSLLIMCHNIRYEDHPVVLSNTILLLVLPSLFFSINQPIPLVFPIFDLELGGFPIFTSIIFIVCECIINSICIRSLGLQTIQYFENKLKLAIDDSIRVSFNMSIASQWLSMRLQVRGVIIYYFLIFYIIIFFYHLFI